MFLKLESTTRNVSLFSCAVQRPSGNTIFNKNIYNIKLQIYDDILLHLYKYIYIFPNNYTFQSPVSQERRRGVYRIQKQKKKIERLTE